MYAVHLHTSSINLDLQVCLILGRGHSITVHDTDKRCNSLQSECECAV